MGILKSLKNIVGILSIPIFFNVCAILSKTSMRVLYPSAHHDRFIHSIGTYHLATLAFKAILNNSQELIEENVAKDDIIGLENTFIVACLMHDCAHAPFSHTCEKFYDIPKGRLDKAIIELFKDKDNFESDYNYCSPAPHEKASALLLNERFGKVLADDFSADPLLAARMIIGCRYRSANSFINMFNNCLIQLLNGNAIDVDKLDYICRDTWASGVNNVTIDTNRLLSSLFINKDADHLQLVFDKSSMSVIQNVVNGRNFLFQWIYAHHKVRYDQYLLEKAIISTAKKLDKTDGDFVLEEIFSLDALTSPKTINKQFSFFLPTDGDIISLMKYFTKEIPAVNEWLQRNHSRKPLWKTYAEFHLHFQNISEDDIDVIKSKAEDCLNNFLSEKEIPEKVIVLNATPSLARIKSNELFIGINGSSVSYTEIFGEANIPKVESFYVYVPTDAILYKNDLIRRLKKLA